MPPKVLRLVLLISCAHALVHMYELSLPGVEEQIAADFFPSDPKQGKEVTGMLSMSWRLPWGIGALFAGLLVDRFGAKRLLLVYLLGVSAVCGAVGMTQPLWLLFVAMFSMGLFASIYHPAGLTWISHRTTPEQRPAALGWHGILGSLGISSGPLLAAAITGQGYSWREYYYWLAVPGVLLASLLVIYRDRSGDAPSPREAPSPRDDPSPQDASPTAETERDEGRQIEEDSANWPAFAVLTTVAICQGIIYSGVLSFLPRYMGGWQTAAEAGGSKGYWATGVLVLGCIGQYTAGYLARPGRLERQLSWISYANAPLLLAMALAATDIQRLVAAGAFSIVHFMHQPIYNSLIASYSPRARRSLAYGMSIAMGLGVGSLGAVFVGYAHRQWFAFSSLAVVALVGGTIARALSRIAHR